MECGQTVELDVPELEPTVLHHVALEVTLDGTAGIVIVMVMGHQNEIRSSRGGVDPQGLTIMWIQNNGCVTGIDLKTGMPVPFDTHAR